MARERLIKVVLLGKKEAGKTLLVEQLCQGFKPSRQVPKPLVDMNVVDIPLKGSDGKQFGKARVWDTTDRFVRVPTYTRSSEVLVLTIDSTDIKKSVKTLNELIDLHFPSYSTGDVNTHFVVVFTKSDLKKAEGDMAPQDAISTLKLKVQGVVGDKVDAQFHAYKVSNEKKKELIKINARKKEDVDAFEKVLTHVCQSVINAPKNEEKDEKENSYDVPSQEKGIVIFPAPSATKRFFIALGKSLGFSVLFGLLTAGLAQISAATTMSVMGSVFAVAGIKSAIVGAAFTFGLVSAQFALAGAALSFTAGGLVALGVLGVIASVALVIGAVKGLKAFYNWCKSPVEPDFDYDEYTKEMGDVAGQNHNKDVYGSNPYNSNALASQTGFVGDGLFEDGLFDDGNIDDGEPQEVEDIGSYIDSKSETVVVDSGRSPSKGFCTIL